MPQTSRGCAVTGSSDSARVYWDFPKNATNEGESAMHMHGNLIKSLATALIGIFCVTVGLGGAAQAQTPNLVQPWGLPPLPPGVGPVGKNSPMSAARHKASSWKAARSTRKAICGSWRSAAAGLHI